MQMYKKPQMALSSLHHCAYLNINGSSQNKAQTFNTAFIKKCDEKSDVFHILFHSQYAKTALCAGYCNFI